MYPLAVAFIVAPEPAALICCPPIVIVPAILKVEDAFTNIEAPVPKDQELVQLVVGVLLF